MPPKSKSSTPAPNGTVEAPIEVSSLPAVVGINFGNTYASIAVLSKEGLAECIANEDGERQIAVAISFHGEELYIGSGAKHQLVKNASNTIVGFRNLLGKKFSEIPHDQPTTSAPVIQHPTQPDEPAYKVEQGTTPTERILTVSEATTIFLRSLLKSAEDFLGRKVTGAVLTVPSFFTGAQRAALQAAAEDAGVSVLQLLDEAGAALVASTARSGPHSDITQLVVDLGQSALSLSLLRVSHGLAHELAARSTPAVCASQIDDRLIKFFAKEFTKKTKTPLTVAPAGSDKGDQRAEARLRLAIEHTKRTVAASAGAATCAVESLKDGLDYTGSINRMRFDMEARPVYAAVAAAALDLLKEAGLDAHEVDELVYVGGSGALPGLDEELVQHFSESVVTPFGAGTVAGGGAGDPSTLLARGCALQADLLASEEDTELRAAFVHGSAYTEAKVVARSLGVLFPEEGGKDGMGGLWVPVVARETALPVRRTVALDVDLGAGEARAVGMEVWEVKEGIKIEKVKPPKLDDEEDEEEEEEEVEVKERTVEKEALFGGLQLEAKEAVKDKGRWKTRVEVQFVVLEDGKVEVNAWEVGKSGRGEKAGLSIAAA